MKFFPFVLLLLILSACNSSDNKVTEIAQRTCDCIRPTFEISQEMQTAVGSTDTAAMMNLQTRFMEVMQNSEACTVKLAEDYPDVDQNGEQAEEIVAEMRRLCPRIMEVALPGETLE